MSDRPRPIIIKKARKKHDAHHGGSWKVAYADFVTAMMAFFLLMWLLAMVSPEKRAALSEYFNSVSVFKDSGKSFSQGAGGTPAFDKFGSSCRKINITASQLKTKLKSAVEERMKALENQIMIDVIDGGVRIQIVDNEGSLMFPSGSAQPTDKAIQILRLVSENIKDTPNKIVVEGHTDSLPFRDAQITNWELSTARASSARRELEKNDIDPGRIARVVGYSDQELLVKNNPKDARNRRISIIVLPIIPKEVPFSSETGVKVAIPNQIPSVSVQTVQSGNTAAMQAIPPNAQPVMPVQK
jgi:chemotaxis protein MotB